MKRIPYPDVDALVDLFQLRMRAILGPSLVGLYLSGSLVAGDFNHDVSDVNRVRDEIAGEAHGCQL